MKHIEELLSAILAGIMIGIGATVYLSVDNHIVGSLLFAIGLYTIVAYQLNLFTGKIGYLVVESQKMNYLIFLIITWIGNLIGTFLYGIVIANIRHELVMKANALCKTKLAQDPFTAVFLGLFCGLLMFIAVDNYKNNTNDFGKIIGVFVCVSIFILCKFEHCVADMTYFALTLNPNYIISGLKYILLVMLGNTFGSFLIPSYLRIKDAMNNIQKTS
jgi:formate/nitrite transporter FocA (FNT family)